MSACCSFASCSRCSNASTSASFAATRSCNAVHCKQQQPIVHTRMCQYVHVFAYLLLLLQPSLPLSLSSSPPDLLVEFMCLLRSRRLAVRHGCLQGLELCGGVVHFAANRRQFALHSHFCCPCFFGLQQERLKTGQKDKRTDGQKDKRKEGQKEGGKGKIEDVCVCVCVCVCVGWNLSCKHMNASVHERREACSLAPAQLQR